MRKQTSTRYSLSNSEIFLTPSMLRRASRETKIDAMRTWFFENYENPVNNTPYESAEGGYIYIWGGPYDPTEELEAQFGGLISEDVIAELSDELSDISWDWTRHAEHDEADDYLFESIARSTEHKKTFDEAIVNIENLLEVEVQEEQSAHLLRLLYVNVITAIETYLSDLFISAVGNDKALLRRFIETTPDFRTEKISIAEVYKAAEDLEKRTRSYLLDVVWHHLGRVKPMFKDSLNIDFPDDMEALFRAVSVRHDLVHRNGKAKDGSIRMITREGVRMLIANGREFVSHIDERWAELSTAKPDNAPSRRRRPSIRPFSDSDLF